MAGASHSLSAFRLYGKTGCSGGKSNGTYFSTTLRYSSILVFTGMFEKSCSTMLLGELNERFARENMAFVFTCPNKDCNFQSLNADDFIGHNCTTAGENPY